jgi:hypothetical protein
LWCYGYLSMRILQYPTEVSWINKCLSVRKSQVKPLAVYW